VCAIGGSITTWAFQLFERVKESHNRDLAVNKAAYVLDHKSTLKKSRRNKDIEGNQIRRVHRGKEGEVWRDGMKAWGGGEVRTPFVSAKR